jgi:hypothetical protein
MNNNPFERSPLTAWILIAIVMAGPVAFIFVMVKFTIGGTSTFCFPFYAGIFLFFAYFCSYPIIQLMTKYTDNGIEQPSIFGPISLSWQDVKEIRNITTGHITILGPHAKIRINLHLFNNPQNLLAEIRSRIPTHVYPSDSQIDQEIYRRKQNEAGRLAIFYFLGAILIFVVGKNVFAIIFGLLIIAFALYQIRKWLEYRRLQS